MCLWRRRSNGAPAPSAAPNKESIMRVIDRTVHNWLNEAVTRAAADGCISSCRSRRKRCAIAMQCTCCTAACYSRCCGGMGHKSLKCSRCIPRCSPWMWRRSLKVGAEWPIGKNRQAGQMTGLFFPLVFSGVLHGWCLRCLVTLNKFDVK